MPYIKPDARNVFEPIVEDLLNALSPHMVDDGTANYIITRIIDHYYGNGTPYATQARGIAVLECAKLEFYRRRMAPYEDDKIKQNGDVY